MMPKATTSITPLPKLSMLKRRVMSWVCEISSLRTASLRNLLGTPTLNFRGTGVSKNNEKLITLKYACCELLSVNSPLTQVLYRLTVHVARAMMMINDSVRECVHGA